MRNTPALSRQVRSLTEWLGKRIRRARIERRMTMEELAARAGVSRSLIHRVERGSPSTAIGSVFEIAAIVGLLTPSPQQLDEEAASESLLLSLLPAKVRQPSGELDDDF